MVDRTQFEDRNPTTPSSWSSYAWIIGGICFVAMYGQQQIAGLQSDGELDTGQIDSKQCCLHTSSPICRLQCGA